MREASAPVSDGDEQPERVDELVISRRFRGPPDSANGGYTCGRLAAYLDGPATVRLMAPPPLDIHLDVMREDQEVQLRSGKAVIARAWRAGPGLEPPAAPDIESARLRRKRYAGLTRHAFPSCFVCGVERREGDGLLIHAGPEASSDAPVHHVACTWTPHRSLCEKDSLLPEPYAWAALDCPGGWSFLSFGDEVALLGELGAELLAPLHCGREYIVAGWEIGREGRKRLTGSALYEANGEPVAVARATWITIER